MNKKIKSFAFSGLLASLVFSVASFASEPSKLEQVVAAKHRTASYAERDAFRHPVETLSFFGLKDDMTVVEISPGGGWYTEILAPYLRDNGTYIAAGYDPKSKSDYYSKNAKKFMAKLEANPELYDKTVMTIMEAPDKLDIAEAGSADMVLSFRNTHNWHRRGYAASVYAAAFKALKPGGVFGVVQHRAGDKHPADTSGKLGYLKQDEVIKLAEDAGFKLAATSEVNANPKDVKNYDKGVWTLPPVYRMGDQDKEKFQAIGESDRMTLKFIKPKN